MGAIRGGTEKILPAGSASSRPSQFFGLNVMGCAGQRAVDAVKEVDDAVIPWFREAARELLGDVSDPEEALARALAKITGHTHMQVGSMRLKA